MTLVDVPFLLQKVKLHWEVNGIEDSAVFEAFRFEEFKKQIEDFMKERKLGIKKNNCWTEVLG